MHGATVVHEAPAGETATRRGLVRYFLWLGTVGFGGPVVLVERMRRDLQEDRHWFTSSEYREGLALAQLAPGPLAAQLAIYLGWIRGGLIGATVVGAAFIGPSFVMVLALSATYVRFGGLPWMRGAFYGIGASVIAIALAAFFAVPSWALTGIHGEAPGGALVGIAAYFAKAGALVFGSGLAIVPFLHGGVVQQMHWLDERQFLDAVAVSMITPGPVVITVAFIGYLVAGPLGACAAAAGVFLPTYLFVVLIARQFQRLAANRGLRAVIDGVTAAATGAIAGAVFVLGRRALTDVATWAIFAATLGIVVFAKRIAEPILILSAGVLGIALRSFAT